MNKSTRNATRIFTIGHSNRSSEDFLSLLREFGIQTLADIRRFPSSRKFSHFDREALRDLLEAEDIHYRWFEALGGRRQQGTREQSPNTGLNSPGFRNYADYMMTNQFPAAVEELLWLGAERQTAVMCAERLYWKCHRRLLSDFLVAQGVAVTHILGRGNLRAHKLTPNARILENGMVIYP